MDNKVLGDWNTLGDGNTLGNWNKLGNSNTLGNDNTLGDWNKLSLSNTKQKLVKCLVNILFLFPIFKSGSFIRIT